MRAICVDGEAQALKQAVAACKGTRLLDDVPGFTRPDEALAWLRENPADLAILETDLPLMNGIELAACIRQFNARIPIIFLTAHPQYALEAFAVHASGYLLKPLDAARLAEEVGYALSAPTWRAPAHICAQTFGYFEILVDGRTMAFRRSKSKELLAYLIDRRGAGVTRQDAFAALWEERAYDHSMQKQLDVVIRSLRDTLQKYGIGDLFELKNRKLRILPELIDCDLYRFLKGDPGAVHAYYGEYMSQYAWGAATEAALARMRRGGK